MLNYVIAILLCIIFFIIGTIYGVGKIDDIRTFGDIYVNGKELYLDANPELFTQKDGQYIIMRVLKVESKQSREKQGL